MRFVKKNSLVEALYNTAVPYPTPSNITYFWSFGILAMVCLVIQLLTGITLAMHYVPHVDLAFLSVEHIMRDINYGWLLRYIHANGASMFFIVVYLHTFRNLYYGSFVYPRSLLWTVGVLILVLMIVTAFLGYVLPWGQMSFWAATVITNVFSAIPVVGVSIVKWLWGGFSVGQPTLNRFYSLHYLLSFVITLLMVIHLIFLHENKSGNPLGTEVRVDTIPFTPYFMVKDLFVVVLFIMFFAFFVFFAPNYLGHPDNYIAANPIVTPAHIVPEWYFLPFYAILRAIPNKLGGVIALAGAIIMLFILPFIAKPKIRSAFFRPLYKVVFWLFVVDCLLLAWIGGKPVEHPYQIIGVLATVFYFLFFIPIVPLIVKLEDILWDNDEKAATLAVANSIVANRQLTDVELLSKYKDTHAKLSVQNKDF